MYKIKKHFNEMKDYNILSKLRNKLHASVNGEKVISHELVSNCILDFILNTQMYRKINLNSIFVNDARDKHIRKLFTDYIKFFNDNRYLEDRYEIEVDLKDDIFYKKSFDIFKGYKKLQ